MTTALAPEQLAAPPRHYLSAPLAQATLPGAGPPQQPRLTRMAERRAFVDIKQRFIDTVADLPGLRGDWLRHQIRQSHEPGDLWLLRGAVFAALHGVDETTWRLRLDLRRALDSVFPDSCMPTPTRWF